MLLVNSPGSGDRFSRASGWFTLAVSASGEAERHQTALRGRAHSPIREVDCRRQPATPQKPLRADEPVKQNGELDPFRVDGVGRRLTAGIETRVWSGQPPSGRVGSVHLHSVVGPHRSGAWVSRVLTIRSPVRGPIQAWWGRACAAARRARSSLRSRSRSIAVAGVAPVRRVAPRTGPEFRVWASDAVHLFSFEGVLVLCA